MKMFLGEYRPSFTSGKRISLPKRLREQISGSGLVLAKGLEKCLLGYDRIDWEIEAQKQLTASISDAKARHLKQYLFSGALEADFDEQGRVVLPENLLQYAGILEKVVVIGAGDHFEIWEETAWQAHLEKLEKEVGV